MAFFLSATSPKATFVDSAHLHIALMQKAQIQWIQIQLGFLILSLRESTWEFMISMDLDGFSHGFSQFNDAESVCVFLSFPSGFWHWKWVVVYWKYHGLCGSTGPYQQWKPWTAEAGGRSSNIDRAGPLESGFVFEIWGTSGTPNPVLIDIMFIKLDVFFFGKSYKFGQTELACQ